MNKILLYIFLHFSFFIEAQITYPSTDFAVAGDTSRLSKAKIDSLSGYNFQLTGTNYIWNYSLLIPESQYIDRYITPSSSGYRLSFISSCIAAGGGAASCNSQWNAISNLAHLLPDSIVLGPFKFSDQVLFYEKTTAALPATLIGMSLSLGGITYPVTEKYSQPDTQYRFPLDYGTTDSCNSSYTIDLTNMGINFTYKFDTKRVNVMEGWGSLTTPYETFASTLKLRSTTYNYDTMVYNGSVIPIPPDTMITYSWFATTFARPVLEVTGLLANGTVHYSDVEYIDTIRCLQPAASFNYSPVAPYLGASTPTVSVSFNNTSNNANAYTWNFGDSASGVANSSLQTNPSHTYDTSGTYKVTLIACNTYCTPRECDTIVIPVTIFDSTNVQASFTYHPLQPWAGDTVTFTNTSLNSTNWSWNFGDGTFSTAKNPQKLYNNAGLYVVTLIATGSGISDTAQETITVNTQPTAIISPSGNVNLCSGQSTMLVASGGQTYLWSNGSVNDTITVSRTGTYTVTAYNSCGHSSQSVTVTAQNSVTPTIVISSPADTICTGSAGVFFASITDGGTNPIYQWIRNGIAVGIDSSFYADQQPANGDSVWCVLTSSISCVATSTDTSNRLKVDVKPNSLHSIASSICAGSSYSFNGRTLIQSGTYYDTLTSANGCDSIITLTLTVKPNSTLSIASSICANSSYSFNGRTFTQTGTYYDTLTSANGCDSIITLTLTVKPNSTHSISTSICANSSYSFNGRTLTQSGNYYDTLTSANGCDSIITLTLTVKPNSTHSISTSICANSSYSLNGRTLTQSGTYYDTLTSANGCDSIITLTLTVKPNSTHSISTSICENSSYSFNGRTLTQSGTYYDTLTSANGCDSIITLTLTVKPNSTHSIASSICENSSYSFNGRTLTQSGTYYDTLTSANGCDSIITLTLTVKPNSTLSIASSICANSSYSFNGRTLTQSGTYYDTLTSANGCDSIITLALTVKPNSTLSIASSICANSSYSFNGRTLTQTGTYSDTLASANGCDSIITLTLTVKPNSTLSIASSICANSSYSFNGRTLTQSGTYYDTLTSANGCDSIITLTLTVKPNSTLSIASSICANSSYSFNGRTLTQSGTYYDTLTSANGCDSITTLTLTVKPNSTHSISTSICANSSYSFNGRILTQSGTYYDTLTSANGCDSIITLALTIRPNISTAISTNICSGSSYIFDGQSLSQSGTYYDTLTSAASCDSVVMLHLQVTNIITDSVFAAICQGSTYDFVGHILSSAGTYRDTLSALGGCDSIVLLNLAVSALSPVSLSAGTDSACSDAAVIALSGHPSGGVYFGTGVTGSSFYPDSAGQGEHIVSYTYTDSVQCSATAMDSIYVNICLGIEELALENDIILSPNPATDRITIQSQLFDNNHPVIKLYDMSGRLLSIPYYIDGEKITADIHTISAGVYLLKISIVGMNEVTKKFVKTEQ
jgi:hypothetical protein